MRTWEFISIFTVCKYYPLCVSVQGSPSLQKRWPRSVCMDRVLKCKLDIHVFSVVDELQIQAVSSCQCGSSYLWWAYAHSALNSAHNKYSEVYIYSYSYRIRLSVLHTDIHSAVQVEIITPTRSTGVHSAPPLN